MEGAEPDVTTAECSSASRACGISTCKARPSFLPDCFLAADPEKADIPMILGRLQPYFGSDALIEASFVDEIPVLASGKRKYTLNTYRD